jgi:hypothetical protein
MAFYTVTVRGEDDENKVYEALDSLPRPHMSDERTPRIQGSSSDGVHGEGYVANSLTPRDIATRISDFLEGGVSIVIEHTREHVFGTEQLR